MVLASLAVVYINTPESRAAGEAAISRSYAVAGSASDADGTAAALGQAAANALVIVAVICAVTFLVVLLYKWRCMKLLLAYMVLASAMLLGYLAGAMWNMAIQIYQLHVDKVTFFLAVYNFCIVGCLAIFLGAGVPLYVTQGYLVASSVIVAWQLSYFDPWTAWLLLLLLALYDLFAVLSPCGPLKALVRLMQRRDAPAMPGLLYEARVRARRPRREPPAEATVGSASAADGAGSGSDPEADAAMEDDGGKRAEPVGRDTESRAHPLPTIHQRTDQDVGTAEDQPSIIHVGYTTGHLVDPITKLIETDDDEEDDDDDDETASAAATPVSEQASRASMMAMAVTGLRTSQQSTQPLRTSLSVNGSGRSRESRESLGSAAPAAAAAPSEFIPLAIARRYRLPTVDEPRPRWMPNPDGSASDATLTVEELRSLVQVQFHVGGGRIQRAAPRRPNEEPRYEVYDREGVLKRTLFVNDRGEVYQDLRDPNAPPDEEARNNIKLGLGDFVFYSILVAKAAMYSFTTFAACSLVILVGLLGTLLLLGIYGKALPALPISIFLGVIFYLLTRYLMQPWTQEIFIEQCYV